jgi:hypothetical protein
MAREVWVVESRWHTADEGPVRWNPIDFFMTEGLAEFGCAALRRAHASEPRSFRVVRYTPAEGG